jgi:prevent-host-death family protein
MAIATLRDAKTGLSRLVDQASAGEFVTITRDGRPVAAIVSLPAAAIAKRAMARKTSAFAEYLLAFPDADFERNPAPSRDVEL